VVVREEKVDVVEAAGRVRDERVRRSVIMRLENVFRLPTNTISPSMKYVYNV